MPRQLIDFEFLKENTFGNTDYMLELIGLFTSTTDQMLDDLRNHCKEQQWGELRKVAHKLKSNYSILGVQPAETILNDLEHHDGEASQTQTICGSIEVLTAITKDVYKELAIEVDLLKK